MTVLRVIDQDLVCGLGMAQAKAVTTDTIRAKTRLKFGDPGHVRIEPSPKSPVVLHKYFEGPPWVFFYNHGRPTNSSLDIFGRYRQITV